MIGCCPKSQKKFKTADGSIDQARFDKIVEEMQKAQTPQRLIDKTKDCSCPCHRDGARCLC
jgi:hypothetical protein